MNHQIPFSHTWLRQTSLSVIVKRFKSPCLTRETDYSPEIKQQYDCFPCLGTYCSYFSQRIKGKKLSVVTLRSIHFIFVIESCDAARSAALMRGA